MYSGKWFSFMDDASVQFFGIGGVEWPHSLFRLFEPKKQSQLIPMNGNALNSFNYIFQKHYAKGGCDIDHIVISNRFAVYLFFSKMISSAVMRTAQSEPSGPGSRESVLIITKSAYEHLITYVVDEADMPEHNVELYDIEGNRFDWNAAL